MHDVLFSPYIVPLGAFAVAIAAIGFGTWKKVRDREMEHERDMRQREMEHQVKLKAMELEAGRKADGSAH